MRIAVFTDAFLPQINGVVTHIIKTIEKFIDHNHKVLVFAPKPNKQIELNKLVKAQIEFIPGLPAIFYPDFYMTNPLSYRILKTVEKFNPDIIHFHTPLTIGFNAIIAAKYFKKPLVSTFHAYFMEPEYLKTAGLDKLGLDENKFINNIGWQFARFFYDQSDVIICPSKCAKKDLINHHFTKTLEIISNGLDLPNTKGSFLKAFEKIKLPKKYFLYVGRISREKSLDLLIKSFKKFTLINKEIDLVIVGDGPAKNDLEKFVASHSLKNRVYFLGAISHDSLMKSNIFPNALAFVSASTSETQGLSVLEACGFKLPVIAVKARALTELVKANGILCQPDSVNEFAKALETITKNFSLRKKFAQKSFQIASHHSLDKTISQLENIYISLINK